MSDKNDRRVQEQKSVLLHRIIESRIFLFLVSVDLFFIHPVYDSTCASWIVTQFKFHLLILQQFISFESIELYF